MKSSQIRVFLQSFFETFHKAGTDLGRLEKIQSQSSDSFFQFLKKKAEYKYAYATEKPHRRIISQSAEVSRIKYSHYFGSNTITPGQIAVRLYVSYDEKVEYLSRSLTEVPDSTVIDSGTGIYWQVLLESDPESNSFKVIHGFDEDLSYKASQDILSSPEEFSPQQVQSAKEHLKKKTSFTTE